jgi:hypothetical protein
MQTSVKLDPLVSLVVPDVFQGWYHYRDCVKKQGRATFRHVSQDPWQVFAREVLASTLENIGVQVCWIGRRYGHQEAKELLEQTLKGASTVD